MHTCIHTYIHPSVHTYIHTYLHTYIHIQTHTYTYMHIHTHTYTYIHIQTNTYTYIHIHTYTYIYIHTHTYTYTYKQTDRHTYIYMMQTTSDGHGWLMVGLMGQKLGIMTYTWWVNGWWWYIRSMCEKLQQQTWRIETRHHEWMCIHMCMLHVVVPICVYVIYIYIHTV